MINMAIDFDIFLYAGVPVEVHPQVKLAEHVRAKFMETAVRVFNRKGIWTVIFEDNTTVRIQVHEGITVSLADIEEFRKTGFNFNFNKIARPTHEVTVIEASFTINTAMHPEVELEH